MIEARDYQSEAHDAVLRAWGEEPWYTNGGEETYRTVVANLATSAGKTVVAGLIIRSVVERGRCLFVADTDELCEQPRRVFERMEMHVGLEKAERYAHDEMEVVVGSAQTLMRTNRLERFERDHFKYIFVDEAHRGSDRNKRIYDYFAGAKVCGITATAFRAKLKDLSAYYEHVAYELGMFDLIGEGYIVPLKVLTLPVEIDISKVRQVRTTEGIIDYKPDDVDETITPYYERIAEMIKEHAASRQLVTFLPLIKSSQEFVRICRLAGISAVHVDGKSVDRDRITRAFAAKQFQVLCNSSLLTTGWDCPPCDCLLNLAPTRSEGLFRQKVGRIGRVLPGVIDGIKTADERKAAIAASEKPDALILDLLWQTEKFGLVGPADIIASNENERLAIQIEISKLRSAEDLQEVAAEVQAAREKQLKEELEQAAKRQRSFAGGEPIELIGALLHSRKLLEYEPVSRWEEMPVTQKQKEWLGRNGLDAATAKNRGQVSALMNLVFVRRKAGLAHWRVVAALEKEGIKNALHWTDHQAYDRLGKSFPFPFGKHSRNGLTFAQVPIGYWEWCGKQDWIELAFPIVWRHMRELGIGVKLRPGWYKEAAKPASPTAEMFDDETQQR